MTKKRAALFTGAGAICILTGALLLASIWDSISGWDRGIFFLGLALSFWVMPWTWANVYEIDKKDKEGR